MRRSEHSTTALADSEASDSSLTDTEDEKQSGKLVLRSHDHQRSYTIEVAISDQRGTQVFQDRYVLFPGETESVSDLIPSGDFLITVTTNTAQRRTLETRLDSSPERTAMIEVGNGVLSLTAGL